MSNFGFSILCPISTNPSGLLFEFILKKVKIDLHKSLLVDLNSSAALQGGGGDTAIILILREFPVYSEDLLFSA